MAKETYIFKRAEMKFMLSDPQRSAMEAALYEYMTPDEFGKSTICNIYYDTPDYRLIRRSLEKPVYKEKMRLRSYGVATDSSKVFLELKKKSQGTVYKRRIGLSDSEAEACMNLGSPIPRETQIAREMDYFRQLYGEIIPAMYICSDREACFCKTDPNLRISFDRNIRWRSSDLTLTSPPYGEQLLKEGYSIMEIKIASAMPLWLTHLLCENHLYQSGFSKYGNAYLAQLSRSAEGSVICA